MRGVTSVCRETDGRVSFFDVLLSVDSTSFSCLFLCQSTLGMTIDGLSFLRDAWVIMDVVLTGSFAKV